MSPRLAIDAPPRGLLLDLDGTVVDTLPFLCDCFREAIAPWVRRQPDNAAIVATFGPPERDNIAQILANPTYGGPEALTHLDEALERFLRIYEAHDDRIVAFPGILEVIHQAAERGWLLGVFTGKGRRPAEYTVCHLGLASRLATLVSGTDVRCPKPDPEGVLLAAQRMGLTPKQLVIVGDSPGDVQAGNAAGAFTAAALWGAFDRDKTRAASAAVVLETVEDLRALIANELPHE